MVNLKLVAQAFSLEVVIVDSKTQWCRIFLNYEGTTEDMGSNSLDIIVKKMLTVLNFKNFPSTPAKLHDGQYICVLMLYEKENSLYARLVDSGVEFQLINALGQPKIKLRLNFRECELWTMQLNKLVSN